MGGVGGGGGVEAVVLGVGGEKNRRELGGLGRFLFFLVILGASVWCFCCSECVGCLFPVVNVGREPWARAPFLAS